MGSSDYGTLYFPHNKSGAIAIEDDVIKKLDANGWSTNSMGALIYGANDSTQLQIRREYIYLMDEGPRTETILRFPTGNKDSTIATIEDIQSYIDTAILGGSW
jgi:hypothetical protein